MGVIDVGGFMMNTTCLDGNCEQELEQLRLIISNAREGIAVIQDGFIHYCNPRLEEFTGYTAEELKTIPIADLVHPDDRDRIVENHQMRLAGKKLPERYEFRLLTRSGFSLWLEITGQRIEWNGKPASLNTFGDISSRKRMEEALARSKTRYRTVVHDAPVGIFQISTDDRFIEVNTHFTKMLGFTRTELMNKGGLTDLLVNPHDHSRLLQVIREQRELKNEQVQIQSSSGETMWVALYLKHTQSREAKLMDGFAVDITENKKVTVALQKSEESIRQRLNAIMTPEGGIDQLELGDFLDVEAVQELMNYFYSITQIGIGIIDLKGNVLVATGWQDICLKYHRVHPETSLKCYESDTYLSQGVKNGEFRVYQCKNGMWDIATPIIIGGKHFGNIFLGQFLYSTEEPDKDFFTRQALKYGFDVESYLADLDKVPRWSHEKVQNIIKFYSTFSDLISNLGLANIKLARASAEKDDLLLQIHENEQKYSRAFSAVRDGIWEWNIPDGTVVWDNRSYEMLGYEPDEFPMSIKKWLAMLHPQDKERVFPTVQQQLTNLGSFTIEFRFKRKDGGWIWIQGRGKVVEHDGQTATVMIGTHTDISDRKAMELALEQSESRLRAMFDNMNSGVVMYHRIDGGNDFRLMALNPKAEEITGVSRAEAEGKTLLQVFPGAFQTVFHRAIQEVESTSQAVSLDPFLFMDSTEERWLASRLYKLPSGEIVVIFDEVTESVLAQKELVETKEAAVAASKAKSEFLANMSHEIRTPLAGILGMLQLLQLTDLTEEQKRFTDDALLSGRRLTTLLTDILDVSAIETGKLRLSIGPVRVAELVTSVRNLFGITARQKNVDLELNLWPNLPDTIQGDELRLRQILFNLVGNALKFTEVGSVTVDIYPILTDNFKRKRMLLTVSDTGSGIEPKYHDVVFEKFGQATHGYTRTHQGAGLGLSIVKHLIFLMRGTMCMCSEPGKGTVFNISLPLNLEAEDIRDSLPDMVQTSLPHNIQAPSPVKHQRHAGEIVSDGPDATSLKVLLVEDERINRVAISRLIEQFGCEKVLTAENGAEALERMKEHCFDIVFMDVQMPVMNGVDATKAIRRGEAGDHHKDVPIVALTAYVMKGDEEKFREAGMNKYLPKPVELSELKGVLCQFTACNPDTLTPI